MLLVSNNNLSKLNQCENRAQTPNLFSRHVLTFSDCTQCGRKKT